MAKVALVLAGAATSSLAATSVAKAVSGVGCAERKDDAKAATALSSWSSTSSTAIVVSSDAEDAIPDFEAPCVLCVWLSSGGSNATL
ncbi:hypothetical protein [Brevundimonas sp. DWR2-3-1b1]|uniref:hypothetical protein n=1 Tax=unclassified Brevundimonas TaxID=2622653 RepID=UPI003CEAC320